MNEAALSVDESLLSPIAGASPVGRDLTYDADVEQLAAEIEKATSLAGGQTDWALVRRESSRALKEGTKDLRLASWWAASGAFVDGWSGAALGVATYAEMALRFWPDMFPPIKRLRARAALVSWLWESLTKAIAPRAVTTADADAVRALDAAVTALNAAMTERLGDANPGLGPLRAVLREKVASIPAPAPPPPPPPPLAAVVGGTPSASLPSTAAFPSAAASVSAAASPPAGASPVGNLDEAETLANRWRDALSTLAHDVRQVAPTSPWPYRLARVSAWLVIDAPPDVENGKTFVPAPRGADRTALADLFESGAWGELREAAEDALSEHLFWLDLHRYSAIALERLGPSFAAARVAVGREVAALVGRIPSLPSLVFSNGTPFASPETVEWLAREGAKGATAVPAAVGDDGAVARLVEECEARIAAGQVDEALAGAIVAAQAAPSAAQRFRGRLAVARIAHVSGKADVALALLEALAAEVDATLEAWEPALCAEAFEALLRVLRVMSPEDVNRQTGLFRRLLRLDPAAALRTGG